MEDSKDNENDDDGDNVDNIEEKKLDKPKTLKEIRFGGKHVRMVGGESMGKKPYNKRWNANNQKLKRRVFGKKRNNLKESGKDRKNSKINENNVSHSSNDAVISKDVLEHYGGLMMDV